MDEKIEKAIIQEIEDINSYSEADTIKKLLNFKDSMDLEFYEIEKELTKASWFDDVESASLLKDEIIDLLYKYRRAYTRTINKQVDTIMNQYKSKLV